MGIVPVGILKQVVNQLLTDSSATVSITYKQNSTSYNAATAVNTITSISYTMKALKIDEMKQEESDNQQGSKYVNYIRFLIRAQYFEDNSITPAQGDYVYYDSTNWEVLTVEPLHCGDT